MKNCPLCNAEVNDIPKFDTGTGIFLTSDFTLTITGKLRKNLLGILVDQYPNTVLYPWIKFAMWGDNDGPSDELKTMRANVTNLRIILKISGYTILTIYSVGYRLFKGDYIKHHSYGND